MLTILRPYGSTAPIELSLRDLTGAEYSTQTLVAGDVKRALDAAGLVNVTNLPTNSSGRVRWTPDTAEMQCKSCLLRIADQDDPAEFIVREWVIETYGHASSMHPNLGLAPSEGGGGEIDIPAIAAAVAYATFLAVNGHGGYGVRRLDGPPRTELTTPLDEGVLTVAVETAAALEQVQAFGAAVV